jgi:phosphoribosylformylglycinamidine cyclo-ligase
MDYQDAGVSLEAGREFVTSIRSMVEATYRPGVVGGFGGFGGGFELPSGYHKPVLVSGTDGVGTKLKVAQALNRHDTVGIDLVAMCVNDILTCGAEPLFFLDYLATGTLEPAALQQVIKGIAQGCQQASCALLGGETAEMPGFYQPQEYDLAGFAVGVVEKDHLLDGSQVRLGDGVVGIASRGVHSNGYSLVRKILADHGVSWDARPEGWRESIGDCLLTPTVIYVSAILDLLQAGVEIHGMAHITGGGLPENLPRCLGPGLSIELALGSWPILPIFDWLTAMGPVPAPAMFDTFNMGLGFALVVPADQATAVVDRLNAGEHQAYRVGTVIAGEGTVVGLPTLGR